MASLSADAWQDLKRNPVFWIASTVVVLMVLIAAAPGLFSSIDARASACSLADSLRPPSGDRVSRILVRTSDPTPI